MIILSVQGVDDCATMAAVFKLLDSFEGVLERPAISAQLESKLVSLLQEFNLDLQEVGISSRLHIRLGLAHRKLLLPAADWHTSASSSGSSRAGEVR